MTRRFGLLAALILFACAGCVQGPPGEVFHGTLPPLAPGLARLVFYRIADPYGATEMSMVSLNDKPAGMSQLGGMFYRDVTPQAYYVTMVSRRAFPNQFKTVAPRAGETFYIRLSTLPRQSCNLVLGIECSDDAFIVQVVAPEIGARDIQGLYLTAG